MTVEDARERARRAQVHDLLREHAGLPPGGTRLAGRSAGAPKRAQMGHKERKALAAAKTSTEMAAWARNNCNLLAAARGALHEPLAGRARPADRQNLEARRGRGHRVAGGEARQIGRLGLHGLSDEGGAARSQGSSQASGREARASSSSQSRNAATLGRLAPSFALSR